MNKTLTAAERATIIDACQSISRSADGLKAGCAIGDEWPDADDKAFYDAELRLLGRLTDLLSATPQPVADDAAAQSEERAAAIEECAKVCDELAENWNLQAQVARDGRYDFMAEVGDRCSDEIRALLSTHPTPQAGAGRAVMDERIARLREAIEGECDGLAVDYHHARAILEYVDGDAAREGEKQ
ncbi:hypothetical protein DIE15_12420 [Burkholderia sp. Bp9031]|uniref:hypothetical protein n=1 Tax=Burkholderia sp. Bp9031 TaxID=2184566 RepID=UPI000F5DD7C6|nr:hypothetical protein [Burkholderia sp. Bp9031]RQZ17270.1 hypothetical protein DIE15_12420 [Burkholderia sp. Bp9031]